MNELYLILIWVLIGSLTLNLLNVLRSKNKFKTSITSITMISLGPLIILVFSLILILKRVWRS